MALGGMLGGGGGKVGRGFVEVVPDASGFGRDLEGQVNKETAGPMAGAGKAAQRAFMGAFAAGMGAMVKSVFDFANFDTGMREVFTLMPGISGEAMGEMTQQVKDFSAEFGVLPQEAIKPLYDSLSAGVPKDNVFQFMEDAQKFAKAGAVDLATSVDGLTSTINAYGMEASDASKVSDTLFTAVKLGKTTVGELSSSMFQVAPIAASFGVTLEDVSAGFATLTAQGTPTAVAATQMKAAISELGKEGTKAGDAFQEITGQRFTDFIAGGGDMVQAASLMSDGAAEMGLNLVDLFGSIEAGQAFVGLSSDVEGATANLEAMQGAAGATDEAFDVMNKGLGATMDRVKAKFSVAMLNLGEALAPSIESIATALGGILEVLTKLPGPVLAMIVGSLTLAAGIAAFAGPILKAIQVFKMLSGVMSMLALNPWFLAALALVAVGVLIYKNWDTIKEKGQELWKWFSAFSTAVADDIEGAWNRIWEITAGIFNGIKDFFVQWWPFILGVFTGGIGLVIGLIIQNWDAIKAKTSEVALAIANFFTSAWQTVQSITSSVGGAVVGFITSIPSKVTSAFAGLADLISAPFRIAFAGIKTAWNATVGGFGFTAPSWVPGFGGKGFTIPSMATGGVAADPMLAMIGDAGAGDPEIVSPKSLMRSVVVDALTDTGGGAGAGVTVEGPLIGQAVIRSDQDIVRLSRELAREVERRGHAAGVRTSSSGAFA